MELADLQAARGYEDLAAIFDVPAAHMSHALYVARPNYRSFTVSKRSGGVRLIESPRGVVRKMQRSLAPVLANTYRPSPHAHGFIKERSVVTNAECHIGKRSVLNIDLLDFFHSISFERIRGMFLARPFDLSWPVANILAQACSLKGRLPAGGITSPAISNIILHRLDRRLASLTSRLGVVYTRYADDLTFSFDRALTSISEIVEMDAVGKVEPGHRVLEIITDEGFSINPSKLRIAGASQRKVITGVVTSNKLNVRRAWMRKLDATIHAIHKFGADSVAQRLVPGADPKTAGRSLLRRVHGQLAYLNMIRGKGDWISAGLAWRFNNCKDNICFRAADVELVAQAHRFDRALVVVTASRRPSKDAAAWDEQGTGFVIASGLIVTAQHVIADGDRNYPFIFVRKEREFGVMHRCEILTADSHRDIAVLKLVEDSRELTRIRAVLAFTSNGSGSVTSVGYPAYSVGHQCSKQRHEVTLRRVTSGVKKMVVSGNVQGGLSGGPVFGDEGKVVGVVHRSASTGMANEVVDVEEIRKVVATIPSGRAGSV